MSTFIDYVAMRAPDEERLAPKKGKRMADPGQISKLRIALAVAGCVLGILLSFVVTDVVPRSRSGEQSPKASGESAAVSQSTTPGLSGGSAQLTPRVTPIPRANMIGIAIVSFVVFMLSFPALYRQLHLYANEPAFLVLFMAFQAGYFWNSVIDGAAKAWLL